MPSVISLRRKKPSVRVKNFRPPVLSYDVIGVSNAPSDTTDTQNNWIKETSNRGTNSPNCATIRWASREIVDCDSAVSRALSLFTHPDEEVTLDVLGHEDEEANECGPIYSSCLICGNVSFSVFRLKLSDDHRVWRNNVMVSLRPPRFIWSES